MNTGQRSWYCYRATVTPVVAWCHHIKHSNGVYIIFCECVTTALRGDHSTHVKPAVLTLHRGATTLVRGRSRRFPLHRLSARAVRV